MSTRLEIKKAQSMLFRFREAQADELGGYKKNAKRPYLISEVATLAECGTWRSEVLREISKKVSKIQDPGLNDFQIRDLNDEINKLLREKNRWENRIVELGGPNYRRHGGRVFDSDGKEVPGNRGYKYFGRAKDLPGVRELFAEDRKNVKIVHLYYHPNPQTHPRLIIAQDDAKRTRQDLYKYIDADYYGYRDEDDGVLLEYEKKVQKRMRLRDTSNNADVENTEEETITEDEQEEPALVSHASSVPTQKDVEDWILRRKKQELVDRYLK
ncbi:hypothetical protein SmJEL517_g04033 [Synchytrium microbalum]|uniref:Pre-mRNA-splicing factor ISY1 n=1 Tax=Synchytrium microbalum TaxID=1806994 RepID=A0A507C4D8_9FUNG|nr:uncharacterized protein SmJEL517_g04033 [Synchytrium microbalum]TPX32984.1 hypothetical protein SmJEL517_g04033 [Synchytrium microbalum]